MERFATQHTCFVSGSVTIVIFLSFKMQMSGGCGNWNPYAPVAFCAETWSFQISIVQDASGGGGGGGPPKNKQKFSSPTPEFFVFFGPPPPRRPPFLEPHLKAMPSVLDPKDLL